MSKYSDKKKRQAEGTYIAPYTLETTVTATANIRGGVVAKVKRGGFNEKNGKPWYCIAPERAVLDKKLKYAALLLKEHHAKIKRQADALKKKDAQIATLKARIAELEITK